MSYPKDTGFADDTDISILGKIHHPAALAKCTNLSDFHLTSEATNTHLVGGFAVPPPPPPKPADNDPSKSNPVLLLAESTKSSIVMFASITDTEPYDPGPSKHPFPATVVTFISTTNLFDKFPKRDCAFHFCSREVITITSARNMFDKLPTRDHAFPREVITTNDSLQHINNALAKVHFLNATITTLFGIKKPLEALIIMFKLGEASAVYKLSQTGLITITDYINVIVLLIVCSTYVSHHKAIELPSQLCHDQPDMLRATIAMISSCISSIAILMCSNDKANQLFLENSSVEGRLLSLLGYVFKEASFVAMITHRFSTFVNVLMHADGFFGICGSVPLYWDDVLHDLNLLLIYAIHCRSEFCYPRLFDSTKGTGEVVDWGINIFCLIVAAPYCSSLSVVGVMFRFV